MDCAIICVIIKINMATNDVLIAFFVLILFLLYNFRFVFLFVLKMGNSDWNCPLIALIMRFFLACTDFCINWYKFDVNRCFFSFFIKWSTSRLFCETVHLYITSTGVSVRFSPYVGVRKRTPPQGSVSHLNRALHQPGCGYQPSEDGAFLLPLPHGLHWGAFHRIQFPSWLSVAG